jgi:hypothetical protein
VSTNLNPELPYLVAGKMLEVAASLDAIHSRTIKAIERLNRDLDARKREIANRWKSAPLDSAQKRALEAREVLVASLEIKANAEAELDGLLKQAGAAHATAVSQRPFWDSPVKTLNRATLGDPKRSEYLQQLADVGPAELAHLAQWAVSTGNRPLAAAVVTRLDRMSGTRPFNAAALAGAMRLEEHRKGSEAIKIAEARFQGVVIAIRAWKAERSNPLHTVGLALQGRTLDEDLLSEMEARDGNAVA